MKRIFFYALPMIALATMLWTSAGAQDKTQGSGDDDDWSMNNFPDNPGLWSAIIHGDKVRIEFGGLHWSSSATFTLSELGTLPTGKAGAFSVKRDAGTVTFNGSFDGNRGHGTYAFEQDPAFRSYLSQEGFPDVSDNLMIHLYFTNINKAWFGYMKQNGYAGITIDELKKLATRDMSQTRIANYVDLFKKDNYGHVSLDMIVRLCDHGATPAFIHRIRELGYTDLPLEQAIRLVDHGVNEEFIEDMKKAGQKNLSLDEAIELQDHGVSAEFIHGLAEAGYPNVTPEEARELVDHGVNADFVKEMRALGFKDMTLDDARRLVDHGVTAEFVKRMQEKGLKNLSLNEYIRLRDGGM
ncbi:MAG TPA: hypothetical protein VGR89_16650 [Puia sp.]|nr:hypothetical protein [Puia sp.]